MNTYKPVQSLQRGVSMIECAAACPVGCGASLKELAAAAGCSVPAAFHLAQTLVACGFLRREENPPRFYPGERLLEIADSQVRPRSDAGVERLLGAVANVCPEAGVFYCNEAGEDVQVYMQRRKPEQGGGIQREVGYALPPYSSVGSVMHLAFWPPERAARYHAAHDFDALGAVLWASHEALAEQLSMIRERGWFFMPMPNRWQLRAGFGVFGTGGVFRGSLTISLDLPQAASATEIEQTRGQLVETVLPVLAEGSGWKARFPRL